jgi:lycopene beta-cyclase
MRSGADLVLVGGGGAAVGVLHRLALSRRERPGGPPLRVVVVDPLDRLATLPDDRTWSFWQRRGTGDDLFAFADRTWDRLLVAGPDRVVEVDLAPTHRYRTLRSSTYYRAVRDLVADPAARIELVHVPAPVERVEQRGAQVRVVAGDHELTTSWVLTSAPLPGDTPPRPRTALWQHFRGVVVQVAPGEVDEETAVLMDLRAPQPPRGTGFGYLLPMGDGTALAEYTVLAPGAADDERLRSGLAAYLDAVGLAGAPVLRPEEGSIPMTDARHRTRDRGRDRVVRIGTVGGATRPSTGYTFTAMQRQAAAVAAALRGGRDPVPPPAYPSRHLRADALLLRGLLSGDIDGSRFFPLLFDRNPVARVLDFLDGLTTPAQDLALIASVPPGPMLLAGIRRGGVRDGAGDTSAGGPGTR